MSTITAKHHRTIPLGKRPSPIDPDLNQLDHPIVVLLGPGNTRQLEALAEDNCRAYLRSVVNPSLNGMERFVLMVIKDSFIDEQIFQLRWCSELPPSVQRVINSYWFNRPKQVTALVSGRVVVIS